MKKLDKVILAFFSVLMFLESIVIILLIVGWLNIGTVSNFVEIALTNTSTSRIILVVALVCLLCSIKCIFIDSDDKEKSSQGVLMENDNGKLLISKPTLENIVMSSVKGFSSIENVNVSTELDKLSHLIVNVTLVVSSNVIIKELTLNIQNKIKEAIKKTSDLEVKEVNVKIKNIATQEEKNKDE